MIFVFNMLISQQIYAMLYKNRYFLWFFKIFEILFTTIEITLHKVNQTCAENTKIDGKVSR